MSNIFKRIISLTLAVLMLLPLVCCGKTDEEKMLEKRKNEELYTPDLSSADMALTADIDLNETHQEIKGFGGINYPGWIDDLTKEQRETAFLNGEDQLASQS